MKNLELDLQKIKGRITEKNLKQEELANDLGITVQALGNKLSGRTDFKHSELTKIFTKLQVTKEELPIFFKL